MRKKILKLLRETEKESSLTNTWQEYYESEDGNYKITECIDFPNYRYVAQTLDNKGLHFNAVKSELKRMEKDGLVSIDIQDGYQYAERLDDLRGLPEMEGEKKTESVILTTKGKSGWKYFVYQTVENRIAFLSLIISVIAVLISIYLIILSQNFRPLLDFPNNPVKILRNFRL
jgi:hypothetical protein